MIISRISIAALLLFSVAVAIAQLPGSDLPPYATDWTSPHIIDGNLTDVRNVSVDTDKSGTMVGMWVYMVPATQTAPHHYASYYARSLDAGKTWGEAQEIMPLPAGTVPSSRNAMKITAGEGGVWMASMIVTESVEPYTRRLGVIISKDGCETWESIIDMSNQFPALTGASDGLAYFDIGYCGNSCWMATLTTQLGVHYTRSTDNGATWEPVRVFQQHIQNLTKPVSTYSNALANTFFINYRDYSLPGEAPPADGQQVSSFSYDNGVSFSAPIMSYAGATDGNGNWILVDKWLYQEDKTPVKLSTDNGRTFHEVPGLPSLQKQIRGLQDVYPEQVAFNESGEIVVTATAIFAAAFTRLQVPGLVTRTNDMGQTWTPWARLQDETGNVPAQALTSTPNGFVSVMAGQVAAAPQQAVYSRSLVAGTPTAASDWQLYQ